MIICVKIICNRLEDKFKWARIPGIWNSGMFAPSSAGETSSEWGAADSPLIHRQAPPGVPLRATAPSQRRVTKQHVSHWGMQGDKVWILKTKDDQKALPSRANNTTRSYPLSNWSLKPVPLYQRAQPHGNQVRKHAAILKNLFKQWFKWLLMDLMLEPLVEWIRLCSSSLSWVPECKLVVTGIIGLATNLANF